MNDKHKIDHTENIAIIQSEIQRLSREKYKDAITRILIIEGKSGTGKTLLAKELTTKGSNFQYIDVSEIYEKNNFCPPDITKLLLNKDLIYLIDEVHKCEQKSLNISLAKHTSKGGVVVLFAQSIKGLKIQNKEICLTLTREGLKVKQ